MVAVSSTECDSIKMPEVEDPSQKDDEGSSDTSKAVLSEDKLKHMDKEESKEMETVKVVEEDKLKKTEEEEKDMEDKENNTETELITVHPAIPSDKVQQIQQQLPKEKISEITEETKDDNLPVAPSLDMVKENGNEATNDAAAVDTPTDKVENDVQDLLAEVVDMIEMKEEEEEECSITSKNSKDMNTTDIADKEVDEASSSSISDESSHSPSLSSSAADDNLGSAVPPSDTVAPNYGEGLNTLAGIAQVNKRIMEDDEPMVEATVAAKSNGAAVQTPPSCGTSKRSFDEDNDASSSSSSSNRPEKKIKIDSMQDEIISEANKLEDDKKNVKKVKRIIKKMSRKEMEEVVSKALTEITTGRAEIGNLRQKCDSQKASIEKWKRKASALQKQCQDLNQVMKRYITEVQKPASASAAAPVKITRSVGLQVNLNVTAVISEQTRTTPNSSSSNRQTAAVPPFAPLVQQPPKMPLTPVRGIPVATVTGTTTTTLRLPQVPLKVTSPIAPAPPGAKALPPPPVKRKTTPSSSEVIDLVDLSDEEAEKSKKKFKVTSPTQLIKQNGTRQITYLVSANGPPHVGNIGTNHPRMILPVNANIRKQQQQQLNGTQKRPQQQKNSQMVTIRGGLVQQQQQQQHQPQLKHPAPLPMMPNPQPSSPGWKGIPPKPSLKISRLKSGIVLSWNLDLRPQVHSDVTGYQIFAYQEGHQLPTFQLWKKVGEVDALPLPMACTLTQFQVGHRYHFAVRAIDTHRRLCCFSEPQTIALD